MNKIDGIQKYYYGEKCQPVLKFKDLSYLHGGTSDFYADVFERNKEKFIESEDFFVSRKQKEPSAREPGSVYIAKDPTTGCLKIGKTTTTVEKRIGTINTNRPIPIEEYVSFKCDDCGLAERMAHEILSDYRTYREWFSVNMSRAKRTVKQVTERVNKEVLKRKNELVKNYREATLLSASGYRKMYDICVVHDKASSEQFGYVMLSYFGRAVAENKELALSMLSKSREDKISQINDAYDRLEEELLDDLFVTELQRKN